MVTDLDPGLLSPPPSHSPPQMEGMVTDLTLAREKQQAFEEWMRSMDKKLKLDLQVTVRKGGGSQGGKRGDRGRDRISELLLTPHTLEPYWGSDRPTSPHTTTTRQLILSATLPVPFFLAFF